MLPFLGCTEPLKEADLMDPALFCQQRPRFLPEILSLKKKRRIFLNSFLTLLFENKTLIWWHIQEMVRIEKGDVTQLVEELSAYSPLLPRPRRLVGTLMIEFADPTVRKAQLRHLKGIETRLILQGKNWFCPSEPVVFPHTYTSSTEKTSSVHFLAFQLPLHIELRNEQPPTLIWEDYKVELSFELWQMLLQEIA